MIPLHPPGKNPAGPVIVPSTLPCPAPAVAGRSMIAATATDAAIVNLRAPRMRHPRTDVRTRPWCSAIVVPGTLARSAVARRQRAPPRSAFRCRIESLGARLGVAPATAACAVAAAAVVAGGGISGEHLDPVAGRP